ncbi:MAG: ribonuclease J [Ruminococcaceae bacterium]|nr:ribonuclease J [Oscillospiraceae bacterium]
MAKTKKQKLKITPLGGIGEVGKNLTAIEYGDDMIIVDCGLGFPDDDMLGIDLVIPDITYLEKNCEKIRAIFLTHGHEDHIGAIPYVLRSINVPIYGTRLTLGILAQKLEEHHLEKIAQLHCIKAGTVTKIGAFTLEAVRVNHSIADSVAYAITTPVGTVVFSGDFKIDITPIDGEMTDLTRFGELGKKGVLALFCESTNAERPGFTPSERIVGKSLDTIFANTSKRVTIATFSSNVHRVQQIINASEKFGRKIAITGRSMTSVVKAATALGYMHIPEGMLIGIEEMKRFRPDQITLITTGSQGEPMSALYRMTYSEHERVKVNLGHDDLVVISATPIPGNEKLVSGIINELLRKGVEVVYNQVADVHVSGHACQDEIKLLTALLKPRFFVPMHGEYKHLISNKALARQVGIPEDNILIPEIGKTIELDARSIKAGQSVPSGKVLVDGYGVGDVGSVVLRDRKHLAQDGLIVVVVAIDVEGGYVLSGPDIVSRGFVYVKESESLMESVKAAASNSIEKTLGSGNCDYNAIKSNLRDDLTKLLYNKTKRKPMILPIIMDV